MNGIRSSSFRIWIMVLGIIVAISVLGIALFLNREGETALADDAGDTTVTDTPEGRAVASKEIQNTNHVQVAYSSDSGFGTEIVAIPDVPKQKMATEAIPTSRNADRKVGEDVTFQKNTSYPDDLLPAMEEFRSNPGFRESSAKRLLPHLAEGMTVEAVTELLGKPTDKDDRVWRYSVFYSKLIEIYFDEKGAVTKIMPLGIECDQLEKSQE